LVADWDELIATLDLPLNLQANSHNQFHPVLTAARARCVAQVKALPVVPNPGHRRRTPRRDAVALKATCQQ
jgi:hypothetical protein